MGRSIIENEAARFLYYEHDTITFPAPSVIYDLITEDGIRIEVKDARKDKTIRITPNQAEAEAFNFFMFKMDNNQWLFVPQHIYFQAWGRHSMGRRLIRQYGEKEPPWLRGD